MSARESLPDRMKKYEKLYSKRVMPLLPTIARLDGRAFHNWTRRLDRPFDKDFIEIMQRTNKELVNISGARVGYTQSDEITLIFYSDNPKSQIFFDGKLQKMISVLASVCTAAFGLCVHRMILDHWGKSDVGIMGSRAKLFFDKPPGTFDCRVFQVPTLEEAVNNLIWREQDAIRNSILSVAQTKFSDKEMYKKSIAELQEMMFQKDGTNWSKDFSPAEKRGSYCRRTTRTRCFTNAEIERLPEEHEARKNKDLKVTRTEVEECDLPILSRVTNRVDVIFNGAEPVPQQEEKEDVS